MDDAARQAITRYLSREYFAYVSHIGRNRLRLIALCERPPIHFRQKAAGPGGVAPEPILGRYGKMSATMNLLAVITCVATMLYLVHRPV